MVVHAEFWNIIGSSYFTVCAKVGKRCGPILLVAGTFSGNLLTVI